MNNQPLNCHIQPNTPFGAILTPQHPGQKIGDLPVAALRTLAQEHHLLVLRGFDSGFNEAEVLTRYAEQWGEIMMWPFGAVLDVKEHPDAKDHIFDSSYVPLHWDGMYKPTIPEFQLFHCVAAPSGRRRMHHLRRHHAAVGQCGRSAAGSVAVGLDHLPHQAGGALRR